MTAPDVDALVARVDALALAHIEEMMALRIASGGDVLMVPVGSLRALLAALREARADGERLDWLAQDSEHYCNYHRIDRWGTEYVSFDSEAALDENDPTGRHQDIRTAIDAARAATGDPK